MNKKTSSSKLATKAAKVLTDKKSSEIAKQLAGSVLSQVNKANETSKEMETKAAKVLESEKYSADTKSLAASVLSQSDKDR